jgi:signal transduction histidine kinase
VDPGPRLVGLWLLRLDTELDIDLTGPAAAGGPANTVEMPVGAAVYFAVAEALANAVRHSGARTVRIHLGHSAGMLRAEITDDGLRAALQARQQVPGLPVLVLSQYVEQLDRRVLAVLAYLES